MKKGESEALDSLIRDLFRVNNLLLCSGDRLVNHLGLTSARWQILGALFKTESNLPVAWLARNMGANRQNVQRIVNDLHRDGLIEFTINPHHKRAQLVVLTEKGKEIYASAMLLQKPWLKKISDGLPVEEIKRTHDFIKIIMDKVENVNS